jgi:NTE family protein
MTLTARCPVSRTHPTGWRLRLIVGIGLLALAGATRAEAAPDVDAATTERPRIGLVLGGGGARGGAHVGVLKVLDELRIPIDCVAGTSMGALVGATFASGAPADAIERELSAINWAATIGTEGQRELLPVQRKLAGITYSNNIQFSIQARRLIADGGFLPSQHVEERLRLLIGKARDATDFDELPIPFRAVATDLAASRMAVLDSGDLVQAMRASMAVPGVFAPVVIGDQVLVDGGLIRNLPVDVARRLCADVVIAVALASPPPEAADLQSPFAVARRSIDAIIQANERRQLASLTDQDVAIIVPVGDIGTSQFDRVLEAIPLGESAARALGHVLRRYALSEPEYRRWRERVRPAEVAPVLVESIHFQPLRHASADYLASRMTTRAGDEVSRAELERDMSRIFASGDFVQVDYRLRPGEQGGEVLDVSAVEKPHGTDFLRFDLGLAGSAGGDVLFALRADHRREWVNALGGQWRNALQLGQLTELETALYQPLDVPQRFYVEPAVRLRRSLEDIFDDGDRLARYDLLEAQARVDVGVNIASHTRLHTGLRWGVAEFELDIGATPLFDLARTRDASIVVGGLYDTRDAAFLPTHGSFAQIEYTSSGRQLGGEQSYQQFEAVIGHSARWRGSVLLLAGGAGQTLRGTLPRYRDFRIGGVRSFPALERGELRGEGYWAGSATWLLRLADIQALFGQAFYGGFGLHAARMTDRLDDVDDGTILGASFTLGARTPAGPLLLSLGAADNGSLGLHIALGRPIAEGSLLDRLH